MKKNIPLKSYEKIEFFLRRHWIILFFHYLSAGFMMLIGIVIFFLADSFFVLTVKTYDLSLFLLSLYTLMVWQFLFRELTDFYLDTWIVTDHRVLEIHQLGLFKRDISELRLSKIQDVNVKVEGFLPTLFNYGHVIIQTAGTNPEFKFEQIPSPQKIKDQILHLYDRFNKEHPDDQEIHEI